VFDHEGYSPAFFLRMKTPEEARFRQLSTQSKPLVDTIKMIAYRAETAMANGLREHLTRPDEARRLLDP
jgi:hypothetical protein